MQDSSSTACDAQQLHSLLSNAFTDSAFSEEIIQLSDNAQRIMLLASRAETVCGQVPTETLTVAQAVLVEKQYIRTSQHVAFQPKPRKIRRPSTIDDLTLHAHLLKILYQELKRLQKKDIQAQELEGGFLVLAFIFEGGILSRRELKGALIAAATQGLRVMGELHYINVASQHEKDLTLDSRRVYLSPLIRALLLRQTPEKLHALAENLDKALQPLGKIAGLPKLTFNNARNAMAAYCEHHLFLPLWLLSWMQHDGIYSSSLSEDGWLRNNGYKIEESQKTDALSRANSRAPTSSNDNPSDPTLPDKNDPVFATTGRILRQPGATPANTKKHIEALAPHFEEIGKTFPAAPVLHQWLVALHDQIPSCATIRLNFFAIAHRLLAYCGETSLDQLSPDDIDLIREQLVEDNLSTSTISNVSGALNHFIRFLGQEKINVTLKLVSAGAAVAIANARILLPNDIVETLEYLRSARCLLPVSHRQAAQDLLTLCFHTGLRRQEALHLDWQQVQGTPADICVRNTVANRLKTISSRRNIPYSLMNVHENTITHHLTRRENGLIIQPPFTHQSENWPVGSSEHRLFGESVVHELHRLFKTVTGDEKITLHSLRHSCATILLILLLAKRFRLHELSASIPLLSKILNPKAEQLVKDLICPTSYQNDCELAAVRDVLGHASETMTLAHYIHALDIFRLAALQPEWTNNTATIGMASGFSDYFCQKYSPEELLFKKAKKTALKITHFDKDESPRFVEANDKATQLLRQLSVVSLENSSAEKIHTRLNKLGIYDITKSNAENILRQTPSVLPLARKFLKKKSKQHTLHDLMPISKNRDIAIQLCENIIYDEETLNHDETLYYHQTLVKSIHDIFINCTRIGSSIVRIPDLGTLRSLSVICRHVLGVSIDTQDFLIWKKKSKTHERIYIPFTKVESLLLDKTKPHLMIFVKLNMQRKESEIKYKNNESKQRNNLSTLIWVMSAYFILHSEESPPFITEDDTK